MTYEQFWDLIHGIGIAGITVRLFLALLCGGLIGLERETKRRPAGFRTHTLICIGATLTTLTSQFIILKMGMPTDPARLGAQVIAGMSFIGAGAIVVTSRRQVKGLTTAAGLWTSAIIGLAIGAGYYLAAVLTVVLVLIAELGLSKFEYYVVSTARTMTVHVEFTRVSDLDGIVSKLTEKGFTVTEIEYTKVHGADTERPSVIFTVRSEKRTNHDETIEMIGEIPGVISVEEL